MASETIQAGVARLPALIDAMVRTVAAGKADEPAEGGAKKGGKK
jgi:hypothetical protein